MFNKEERLKYIGFNDFWFLIIGIPFIALFIPVAFFDINPWQTSSSFFLEIFIESIIHTVSYWFAFRFFIIHLRKRFPDFDDTRKRIWIELVFIVICGWVISATVGFCLDSISEVGKEVENMEGFIATYFTSFFVVSIYEGVYLYHQNRLSIKAQESLKREHINSELQGLRNQVNPHFLFNSLNTLMNIIREDQDLAESFLTKLSSVYRYTLENRDDQLVPLKEELRFIESYVFLLKERFRNNIEVCVEVSDDHLEKFVVPMSMQLLFENVIKHNILSAKQPLKIEVYLDEDQNIVVRNNIQLKKQIMPSTGVGLNNISSRISYFTENKLQIIQDEDYFKVSMPLIDKYKAPRI